MVPLDLCLSFALLALLSSVICLGLGLLAVHGGWHLAWGEGRWGGMVLAFGDWRGTGTLVIMVATCGNFEWYILTVGWVHVRNLSHQVGGLGRSLGRLGRTHLPSVCRRGPVKRWGGWVL